MPSFPLSMHCPFCFGREQVCLMPAHQRTEYVAHERAAYYKCNVCDASFSIRLDEMQEGEICEDDSMHTEYTSNCTCSLNECTRGMGCKGECGCTRCRDAQKGEIKE